jgi:hypothetical protein
LSAAKPIAGSSSLTSLQRVALQGDGSLRKIETIAAKSRKRRNVFCTSRRWRGAARVF